MSWCTSAFLCGYFVLASCSDAQVKTVYNPNGPPPEAWLPMVLNHVLFVQQAWTWERIDQGHGRLVVDVNGRNFEVVTGQEPRILPLQRGTRQCFGESIDVGSDVFGLSPSSPALSVFERLAHAGGERSIDEIVHEIPISIALKLSIKAGFTLLTLLDTYVELQLERRKEERQNEANRVQKYLDTPAGEAAIEAILSETEAVVRRLDPDFQRTISEIEKGNQTRDQTRDQIRRLDPNDPMVKKAQALDADASKRLAELRLVHYGRPECFAHPQ
jgi:hypothetical protein